MLVARVSNTPDKNDIVSLEEVGWMKPSILTAILFEGFAALWPDGLHIDSMSLCDQCSYNSACLQSTFVVISHAYKFLF